MYSNIILIQLWTFMTEMILVLYVSNGHYWSGRMPVTFVASLGVQLLTKVTSGIRPYWLAYDILDDGTWYCWPVLLWPSIIRGWRIIPNDQLLANDEEKWRVLYCLWNDLILTDMKTLCTSHIRWRIVLFSTMIEELLLIQVVTQYSSLAVSPLTWGLFSILTIINTNDGIIDDNDIEPA